MDATRPLMLGVVGESAAGKTTLTRGLARLLGGSGVTPLCLDDYHRYDRAERARRGISASDPDANYLDQMAIDLAALRAGRTITKPVYDHRQGILRGPEVVTATGLVLAYGMLTLTLPAVAELFDLTVYLDPDPALLRRWRFERDVNERGYTPDEVQAHEIARAQDAQRFIIGQRARADLVIRFRPGDGDRLGVTIFQRRQPPAFDWNLITGAGMAITPAVVDDDGCTSTVLQIAPTANPADVRNAQCALWSSLAVPRASLDPARLADDPTTAFVQTFVAYHLLRTRLYG